MLFAHVKWFVENQSAGTGGLSTYEILFVMTFLLIGTAILWFIDGFIKKQKPIAEFSDKLQFLRPWLPTITRFVLGLMFIYSAYKGYFLVPNMAGAVSYADGLVYAIAIISPLLLLGLATRYVSTAIMVIYLLGVAVFGIISMLEHIEILGLSAFLFIEGGGKLAMDNHLFKIKKMPLKYREHALRIIIVTAGISFSVLAFTEKLANINLASVFLMDHDWNFLEIIGASNRQFIIFIGASELVIGVSLILGLASRLIVVMLLGLLSLTAILLGMSEVVGHAFAVSVVTAAWLNKDLPLMKTRIR